MKNKFLIIIIVAIIAVIAIAAAFTMGLGSNNEMSDSSDWGTKELGDLKFKVPDKYKNGAMMSGNVVDGVEAGDTYQSEDLTISINDNNWTSELDKYMNSTTATMVVLDINGTEIETFSDNGNSVAFFEINGSKVAMSWSGNDVTGDIKAIIASFFQLNK